MLLPLAIPPVRPSLSIGRKCRPKSGPSRKRVRGARNAPEKTIPATARGNPRGHNVLCPQKNDRNRDVWSVHEKEA